MSLINTEYLEQHWPYLASADQTTPIPLSFYLNYWQVFYLKYKFSGVNSGC
jgi:hypothetical protein